MQINFLKLEPASLVEFLIAFLICLVCFLIGYLFARSYYTKKYKQKLGGLNLSVDTTSEQSQDYKSSGIRAVQTMDRSGKAIEDTDTPIFKGVKSTKKGAKPELNFGSIGVAHESEKDDLKKIRGIGTFIEQKLNGIGIYTFEQISRFTEYDIETVTQLIEFFPGRIKRDDWKGQANALKEAKDL